MPDNNTVPVQPVVVPVPATPQITPGQALGVLFGSRVTQTLLILVAVGASLYSQFAPKTVNPVNPAPSPYPQKTLRDAVSPEAATELAGLYQALATGIANDFGRKENKNKGEGPQLNTVGDLYQAHFGAMQNFQTSANISGIASINEPISAKLKVATGTMKQSQRIDDPASNIRESWISICKSIADELDPRAVQIPVGRFY